MIQISVKNRLKDFESPLAFSFVCSLFRSKHSLNCFSITVNSNRNFYIVLFGRWWFDSCLCCSVSAVVVLYGARVVKIIERQVAFSDSIMWFIHTLSQIFIIRYSELTLYKMPILAVFYFYNS